MLDHSVREYVAEKLAAMGLNSDPYGNEPTLIFIVAAVGVALISYLIVHRVIVRSVNIVLSRTNEIWGSNLAKHEVLEKIALLVPLMILELLVPPIISQHPLVATVTDRILSVMVLVMFIWTIFALLDALNDIATAKGITRRMPIKSFVQLIKLFLFFVGIVVSISILADESPIIFLSGLGVATGLVMLVFKDTILGFVAGIQLSANRMVSLNDWIEMDDFGASGSVEEISLTTVKVRNFDNTVSMLPAYALVQNAFINWQGMSDSGGRRIMRAINIDQTSIRFMEDAEIESLKEIRILREYLFERTKEISEFNENIDDIPHVANTRHMTNIGVFRAYLTTYLRSHKDIHPYMLFMVRQLAPTAEGLPLQIYAFTNSTDWVFYEGVQADIFDHIYSIMPIFGLRPFQAFGGSDASKIGTGG
ncbi:mechanosensitive ion channel family protein [Enterovibrio norvegicus]|uniref:Mechanosensitive ion channel protein MscS n=1 Tax=Enterovibrio norvegicus TaxID=188144 RepID=A0A2N7L779_9GAMM|nr:mechanosensitive ion channel family protein [Enterovibrio norvegicus]PML78762.1 mechanosensitive ion channel protein MscS [Enterovibrio norvegicus]PMN70209.1 mechanosensitive ion channel protein MscS [Enterovibrio norvegicus]PMN89822.1 mechanosensitive ion channel protein MscS [Enterovibrio norvegicus]